MNNRVLNLLRAGFVATAIYANPSHAHTYIGTIGNLSQGNGNLPVSNTDLFQVSCFTDPTEPSTNPTHQLYVNVIQTTSQPGSVSAQAFRMHPNATYLDSISVNTTDTIGGDTTGSPDTWLINPPSIADGDATYYISVDRSVKGSASLGYTLTFHCLDAAGVHTGTDITIIQNQ